MTNFAERVQEAMKRKGMSLRALCRAAVLDPSFFSKVLAGKRSPPSSEETLRRLAEALGLDPSDLILSAGRIPSDWMSGKEQAVARAVQARLPAPAVSRRRSDSDLGEELL